MPITVTQYQVRRLAKRRALSEQEPSSILEHLELL